MCGVWCVRVYNVCVHVVWCVLHVMDVYAVCVCGIWCLVLGAVVWCSVCVCVCAWDGDEVYVCHM